MFRILLALAIGSIIGWFLGLAAFVVYLAACGLLWLGAVLPARAFRALVRRRAILIAPAVMLLGSFGSSPASAAAAYYVATNGNDSWSGILPAPNSTNTDGPFATLQKAEQAMAGSSIKTTYLRAGAYSPAASGGTCGGEQGAAVRLNGPTDNGETWSYYPPDGYDSAIINGGPSRLECGFDIENNGDTISNITIDGLTLENFTQQGILVIGGFNITLVNNIVHDIPEPTSSSNQAYTAAIEIECRAAQSNWGGFMVNHNYIYNIGQNGTRLDNGSNGSKTCGATNTPNNTVFSYNYLQNVCTTDGDCGALYFEDDNGPASAPILIEYNYVNGVDINQVPDPVTGTAYTAAGIYWDGNNSYFAIKSNIFVLNAYDCIGGDGFGYATITGNICDLTAVTDKVFGLNAIFIDAKGDFDKLADSMGNQFTNNIIVASSSSSGNGYDMDSQSNVEPAYVTNNAYYNYGSAGAINYSCSHTNCTSVAGSTDNYVSQDTNPIYENPQLCGWTYDIKAGSLVYNPVGQNGGIGFPAQPANWGQPGFWGPPGFIIPHTGTTPSPPTSGCNW